LLRENAALTARVTALEGRRPVALDRVEHTTIPAPYEGQIVVELDDTVWYYSNSTWRQLGAAAAGGYRNSSVKYAMAGAEWKTAGLYSTTNVTATVDTASPFGGYVEINGDEKYFVIGAPLGPKGSTWCVSMGYRKDTDAGLLVFDWQTTLVDGLFTGYGYGAGPFAESVEGPETYNTTFYKNNSATSSHQDFYAGVAGDFYSAFYSVIRIGGTGSTMLSSTGNTVSDNPWGGAITQREMNGGGDGNVMWWLRTRVSGKNASSSAYKARIYYLAIKRVENTTGFTIA